MGKCVSILARSFFIESSSNVLVFRTGIKAREVFFFFFFFFFFGGGGGPQMSDCCPLGLLIFRGSHFPKSLSFYKMI